MLHDASEPTEEYTNPPDPHSNPHHHLAPDELQDMDPPHTDTTHPHHSTTNTWDDVWDDHEPHEPLPNRSHDSSHLIHIPTNHNAGNETGAIGNGEATPPTDPDTHKLWQTHATAGYRDGISASKATSVQAGFDEGFALGGEIGRVVGYLNGCFEGIVLALLTRTGRVASGSVNDASQHSCDDLNALVLRAVRWQRECAGSLSMSRLFAPEFIDDAGVWRWSVTGDSSMPNTTTSNATSASIAAPDTAGLLVNDHVTFRQIAESHPLIAEWRGILNELESRVGLDLGRLERELGTDGEDGAGNVPVEKDGRIVK